MPTTTAILDALALLGDVSMIRVSDDPQHQAASWAVTIDPDMPDSLLSEAVRRLASGEIEVYGQVKPSDLNRAARAVRRDRIASFARERVPLTEKRDPFEQSVYASAFYRAIGNGKPEPRADQEARAAVTMANLVADSEPDTPVQAILERIRDSMKRGRTPWADGPLPPSRQVTSDPKPGVHTGRPVTLAQIAYRAATTHHKEINS